MNGKDKREGFAGRGPLLLKIRSADSPIFLKIHLIFCFATEVLIFSSILFYSGEKRENITSVSAGTGKNETLSASFRLPKREFRFII